MPKNRRQVGLCWLTGWTIDKLQLHAWHDYPVLMQSISTSFSWMTQTEYYFEIFFMGFWPNSTKSGNLAEKVGAYSKMYE